MISPWLGVWRDGKLWFRMAGAAATAWICDRYGIVDPRDGKAYFEGLR